MKKEYYKNLKLTPIPGSEITIEGEIPSDIFDAEHKRLLGIAYRSIEVPGFRVGKAPEHLAKAHLNENMVLDRTAEEVFKNEYPEMIAHHKLFPIDRPQIQITKIAPGNPLGFKIVVPVMPEIKLPDYKKSAKESNKKKETPKEVAEKEVSAAIEHIQQSIAHQEYHKKHPEDTEHKHDEKLPLPELTDEFVQKLGDFKNVGDFKIKLKKNLEEEQLVRIKEKQRIAIVDTLVKEFSIDLPRVLIESELDRMVAELMGRINSAGIKPAEYFTQIGKKEEDLKKEWRPDAEKRVKTDIVLAEIAKQEKIKPESAHVEQEVKNLITHYKDADPTRARSYVEHMLTNDKVFEYLESL